ncbi:MAG: glutamine--fructose-6-phosphate transaminase (isomerizing) [Ruminococcus sp.]|nr:glutamine--fructose-6-phosphate transaminase (isomerizing) [Candidatus Apopatosoma intestinale]
MCGIIGYTGAEAAAPKLLTGLRTLEYRGYDSAGIALSDEPILTVKAKGRIDLLETKVKEQGSLPQTCGIGHTRWATHGAPSDVNSHPHRTAHLCLVHNGIIENYAELGEELKHDGYSFASETDTEIAACLIDRFYRESGEPVSAIAAACKRLRGSYAFGILFEDRKNVLYAVRKDSPLIAVHTGQEGVIASDIPAVLAYSHTYYRLEEGVIAELSRETIRFWSPDGREVTQQSETVDWNVEQAQKGGFPYFMIKEIHEEPTVLRKTVEARLSAEGLPFFGVKRIDEIARGDFDSIQIVGCGSAMHIGLVGRTLIEDLARIPVSVEIASEFRYRDPIVGKRDIVILISQSGETADTVAALRHAKEKGAFTLAIVNVIGSTVAREADGVIYTWAGPEIAVATTKAYSVQGAILYLLAIKLAIANHRISEKEAKTLCFSLLREIPDAVQRILNGKEKIAETARLIQNAEHVFFIGRKADWDICVEGSLKLKEISYIHSEAYATGELKHGTISLVTDGTPVIALMTQEDVCEKTVSGIREVKARGAFVVSVCRESLAKKYEIPCDACLTVPDTEELFSPLVAITALQLLAYYVSEGKGIDVDKPRNLAKSVTVE